MQFWFMLLPILIFSLFQKSINNILLRKKKPILKIQLQSYGCIQIEFHTCWPVWSPKNKFFYINLFLKKDNYFNNMKYLTVWFPRICFQRIWSSKNSLLCLCTGNHGVSARKNDHFHPQQNSGYSCCLALESTIIKHKIFWRKKLKFWEKRVTWLSTTTKHFYI